MFIILPEYNQYNSRQIVDPGLGVLIPWSSITKRVRLFRMQYSMCH